MSGQWYSPIPPSEAFTSVISTTKSDKSRKYYYRNKKVRAYIFRPVDRMTQRMGDTGEWRRTETARLRHPQHHPPTPRGDGTKAAQQASVPPAYLRRQLRPEGLYPLVAQATYYVAVLPDEVYSGVKRKENAASCGGGGERGGGERKPGRGGYGDPLAGRCADGVRRVRDLPQGVQRARHHGRWRRLHRDLGSADRAHDAEVKEASANAIQTARAGSYRGP
ncbi:hypothetical protein B0H13DRAFT_1851216 [Mycena leptocephala]|nr:hypothetical protein B0H13DRAFT_1851216 [Mycena leptocephala]